VGFALSTFETDIVESELELDEQPSGYGSAGGEDVGLNSALQIKSKITIKLETINADDIVTSNFKKVSREDTLIGLSGVIGEWGVVTPIHVLKLEDNAFMLFDGLRRLFGSLRSGKKEIPAQVWYFSDPQEGKEMANVLSLMINRSQRFTAKEQWEQMQILEEVNGASPGLIEFLLQMHAGDAMKLKDVMLSDIEYSEIRADLTMAILTIDGAYKKLCAARKKENRLAKEDALVLEGGESPSSIDDISDEQNLSVDEVKDLLDLTSMDVGNSSLEELNKSEEARGEPHVQDVNDRHPLDPKLKQAVMIRDEFSCQCCKTGGQGWLSVLVVHHIIQVSQGGPDAEDNLVVLCQNCHITLHNYAWGKIYVKLEELDEGERKTFKNIFKYGNVIIEADKRIGRSREQSIKEDRNEARHMRPGEGLSANKSAFAIAEREKE
jgi:hypothetical protein